MFGVQHEMEEKSQRVEQQKANVKPNDKSTLPSVEKRTIQVFDDAEEMQITGGDIQKGWVNNEESKDEKILTKSSNPSEKQPQGTRYSQENMSPIDFD